MAVAKKLWLSYNGPGCKENVFILHHITGQLKISYKLRVFDSAIRYLQRKGRTISSRTLKPGRLFIGVHLLQKKWFSFSIKPMKAFIVTICQLTVFSLLYLPQLTLAVRSIASIFFLTTSHHPSSTCPCTLSRPLLPPRIGTSARPNIQLHDKTIFPIERGLKNMLIKNQSQLLYSFWLENISYAFLRLSVSFSIFLHKSVRPQQSEISTNHFKRRTNPKLHIKKVVFSNVLMIPYRLSVLSQIRGPCVYLDNSILHPSSCQFFVQLTSLMHPGLTSSLNVRRLKLSPPTTMRKYGMSSPHSCPRSQFFFDVFLSAVHVSRNDSYKILLFNHLLLYTIHGCSTQSPTL